MGAVTSPCCPSPSKRRGNGDLTLLSLSFARRGTFWRKPKQGEVRIGGQETTGSTRRETSPCLLRRHPSPSQRRGNCDLTLLSLSFTRRGTFWRKPKQGEVRTGRRETAVSTRRETSPCLLRRHPSPSQGEGIATSPCCPSPSQGEGRFGGSQNRVRSARQSKFFCEFKLSRP